MDKPEVAALIPLGEPAQKFEEWWDKGGLHQSEKLGVRGAGELAWNAALASKAVPLGEGELRSNEEYLKKAQSFLENSKKLNDSPLAYMIAAAFKNEDRVLQMQQREKELVAELVEAGKREVKWAADFQRMEGRLAKALDRKNS